MDPHTEAAFRGERTGALNCGITQEQKEVSGLQKKGMEAAITEDFKVTLKKRTDQDESVRMEPEKAAILLAAFQRIAKKYPQYLPILRALVDGQPLAADAPEPIQAFRDLGLIDGDNQLRPHVRDVFFASCRTDRDGRVSFETPFAPANAEEERMLLRMEAKRDQRMGEFVSLVNKRTDGSGSPPLT